MLYSGARILVETLIEQGVDTIFGYPGASVLGIYDELCRRKDSIAHILVSHEQHAAHAADGYARSSGRVGVCLATSGPGATNLVTGIATAFVDSVPIVAVTGNVSIALLGKDSFQEVDIAGITMPIVKHNWIVKDARDIADIVREAFIVAKSGRPGPVLIDIPKDISAQSFEYSADAKKNIVLNGRAARILEKIKCETFNEDDIERAAALINNSQRPLLYAGGGVKISGADAEVQKLAELINAPIALSLMGMGAFPSDHPLCTGLVGMHGSNASKKAAQKTDLLIAVGARFSDRVTGSENHFARGAKIIHIDIDPAEINKNAAADVFIIGDLKAVLARLVKKTLAKKQTQWSAEIIKWKEADLKEKARKKHLHPRFIIRESAKVLGENTIVVTDVGQHQMWSAQYDPFKNSKSFLSSGGMGTMGYGMGASCGAKIANPDNPVVLFTGDGSFRMNSAEMATMVKYKLPILIILFNNNTLGMLRQWQDAFYKGIYFETNLDNCGPDFIALANAYEVTGFRITDESSFLQALEKSKNILASGKPVLIEAVIDKNEKVLPFT
jgi:acetolactate synthase-1/2/3 large subunit